MMAESRTFMQSDERSNAFLFIAKRHFSTVISVEFQNQPSFFPAWLSISFARPSALRSTTYGASEWYFSRSLSSLGAISL